MERPPLPPDGDRNRAPSLLAVFWVPFPLTVAALSLRLYVRIKIKSLGLDDYLMIVAWVLYLVSYVLLTVAVLNGSARHAAYLSPESIETILKYTWIAQSPGIMNSAFGKSSVAVFQVRLMGPNNFWRKWTIYIVLGIYVISSILAFIFGLVQCRPTSALWHPMPGAKCWDPSIVAKFGIYQSGLGTFVDFFLALLPITIFAGLKLSVKTKISLSVLLGLGLFAGVCGAIRTAQLHFLAARADFTWESYPIVFWSSLEIALVIICGSVPAVKPLWDQIVSGRALRPNRTPQYPDHSSYQMQSDRSGKKLWRSGNSTDVSKSSTTDRNVLLDGEAAENIHVVQSFHVDR